VFDIAFLKVDSDQALQTAQKHGGDKLLQKAPDIPILYILDWNNQTNELTCTYLIMAPTAAVLNCEWL